MGKRDDSVKRASTVVLLFIGLFCIFMLGVCVGESTIDKLRLKVSRMESLLIGAHAQWESEAAMCRKILRSS